MHSTGCATRRGRHVETAIDIDGTMNMNRLEQQLPSLQTSYRDAQPYPHVVIDDVLTPAALAAAYTDFAAIDPTSWTNYLHVNSKKFANTNRAAWGATLREIEAVFASPRFVAFLEALTGIEGLLPDPQLDGGGLHRSLRGGHLNVHADFTAHRVQPTWRRRVNLLLYLNEQWEAAWGGDLELWDKKVSRCEATVAPVGNRMLIFTTDQDSFHGHAEPLTCPEGVARQSLALYYFTEEAHPVAHATDYRARPGDGVKRVAIYLDKKALAVYGVLRRRFKFSDETMSKVLGVVSRKKKPSS